MNHFEDILELSRHGADRPLSPWFGANLRNQIQQSLFLPPEALEQVGARLTAQLRAYREQTDVSTAVLGMSGGVDSALSAALLKEAGWRVVGYTLPIEQDPVETERGIEACRSLEIDHIHLDLSEQYWALVKHLGSLDESLLSSSQASRTRRGNIRARLRMTTLYDQAHRWGGLVASTDNLSELGAGFWTLHGDVGDLAPIQSLLKSWEVPWMARRYGVPQSTWRALPTDGLGIGNGDEAQIGASYLEWDIAVFALAQKLADDPAASEQDLENSLRTQDDPHAMEVTATVLGRLRNTWYKRVNPIALDHPKADRFGMLKRLDQRLFRPALLLEDRALTTFSGEIETLGHRLAIRLCEKRLRLVTAESCTAGLLGAAIAASPGSSRVLEGSFITYSPTMKTDALGVPAALIEAKTVYDPQVARAMAEGALVRASGADLAISITGVAGPETDQGKPVGLVYISTLIRGGSAAVIECNFEGTPQQIVSAAICKALHLGLDAVD